MPESQAQPTATTTEMTPAQSHAEIQQLLRAEIDALRDMLEDRFREIAMLTAKLEELGGEFDSPPAIANASLPVAQAAPGSADVERRHKVELALQHAKSGTTKRRPCKGVPPFRKQAALLAESPLFDAGWYLQTYPDVAHARISAKDHYIRAGAFEGRNPGPDFNSMAYYLANPDVAEAGWPALVHYLAFGQAEGRPRA
ncbi:hypothetical protein [Thalassovita mangrovi]|uniref:Uncharacterized protein n=1 Tax=Thalassovita mangrovi TaxID=2692236 RepID=A0A6L8LIV0_9RHOB|nr:hypothetical protein [Thalassovita mangrovi]MYM55874.1 hypothetical protein [Thalassovita mangrovi]